MSIFKQYRCLILSSFLLGLTLLSLGACRQPVTLLESNLPIVVIDTGGKAIPDEPKITAQMGIISNEGVNSLSDDFNAYDGPIGIELRGSSSQFYPKKQYGLETRDETGEDANIELLGLPEENDWVLYAPYSDKSLIRNALVYETARELGYYASRHVFVETVLNGDYQGVYVLFEKIKRDKNRVDISKLEEDDVSGGYLLELEFATEPDEDEYILQTPRAVQEEYVYYLEYPDGDDIEQAQEDYIIDYLSNFETALYSKDFADPVKGYRPYINESSFIDHTLLNEVFKNTDYFFRSTFMYKDKEGVLHLGPLWDYNVALGNHEEGELGTPEGFLMTRRGWAKRLLQDKAFAENYVRRYQDLRSSTLSTASLLNSIDTMSSSLDKASERNFRRWPILGVYVWPNRFMGDSYSSEIDYLKDWLETRLAWLDTHMEDLLK